MFKRLFLPWLCGQVGPWCIESLGSSLRWEIRGRDHWEKTAARAHVLVFWHARILFMAYFFRHRGYHVISSDNVDGELVVRAVAPMGIGTLRGSTSRGATKVLLAAGRLIQSGQPVAFTPDGPRGPRHEFQPGALFAARVAQAQILPVTVSADRAFVFSSWDRFILPRQGARAVIQFLPPHPPPSKGDLESSRLKLQTELATATDLLDKELGLVIPA